MLHKKFFQGREVPQVDPDSVEMDDWMEEQEYYVKHGFEYEGTRITGSMYHFLNFFKIMMIKDLKTNEVGFDFPRFSQEDDYILKQDEEADKSGLYTGLITGRGFGKTYLAINEAAKNFNWVPFSQSYITASIDEACAKTFSMLDTCLWNSPEFVRQNRLKNDTSNGWIISGTEVKIDGQKRKVGNQSEIKKIIYEDNAGKTRGSRPTFQLYEEIGAWTASAGLIDCLSQSRGSFFRGSIKTGKVWLIGTGGQMKTGGSADAQKIFNDPLTYNVYPAQEWYGRKTMIFMPAFKKLSGYYEKDGVSDEEGAKSFLTAEREKMKEDQDVYMQFIQEYPFEPREAFITSGSKRFNQERLQRQEFLLNTKPEFQGILTRGRFWPKKDKISGKVIGAEFAPEKNGPIQLLETAEEIDGRVPENLYISGVDSVDGDLKKGSLNTMKLDENGLPVDISKLSFFVKKRFYSSQRTHNIYVCQMTWRPENIDDAYEQVLLACMYYNMQVNVEHTKIGIIKYFQQKNAMHRLFKRPGVCYNDVRRSRNTHDYGTSIDGAGKVLTYGMNSISRYIDNFSENIFFLDLIKEFINFEDEERTKFDRVMGVMMTEIADDELMDISIRTKTEEEPWVDFGYYTDPRTGKRVFGELPQKNNEENLFGGNDIFVKNSRIDIINGG